jgi:hypothetical protein
MQKMVVNQAMETSGIMQTQKMATLFDGILRHSLEGIAFKQRVEKVGWKQAVEERDTGSFDWTKKPINLKSVSRIVVLINNAINFTFCMLLRLSSIE